MSISRHKTKVIRIGKVKIGGNNPVAIQSMAKVKTSDVEAVVRQIKELEQAGCEIVRVAVKDTRDAAALKRIKQNIGVPLVADIHFDWRLALAAIDSGVDKIRLNPGNIYKSEQIRDVAAASRKAGIPIRVGVNSGSLSGRGMPGGNSRKPQAQQMVESALKYVRALEKNKFSDIVISLKASNTRDTVMAYRQIARVSDYPLHLGVTATGLSFQGAIASSAAIGSLLIDGIGDTIRVSLTDKPKEEIRAARAILEAAGVRQFGPQIISCPTCGRCEVDLVRIVKQLDQALTRNFPFSLQRKPLKVAVMGCVVNGPGEAKEADIGIAFGKGEGLLFKHGKPVRKVADSRCVEALIAELKKELQ